MIVALHLAALWFNHPSSAQIPSSLYQLTLTSSNAKNSEAGGTVRNYYPDRPLTFEYELKNTSKDDYMLVEDNLSFSDRHCKGTLGAPLGKWKAPVPPGRSVIISVSCTLIDLNYFNKSFNVGLSFTKSKTKVTAAQSFSGNVQVTAPSASGRIFNHQARDARTSVIEDQQKCRDTPSAKLDQYDDVKDFEQWKGTCSYHAYVYAFDFWRKQHGDKNLNLSSSAIELDFRWKQSEEGRAIDNGSVNGMADETYKGLHKIAVEQGTCPIKLELLARDQQASDRAEKALSYFRSVQVTHPSEAIDSINSCRKALGRSPLDFATKANMDGLLRKRDFIEVMKEADIYKCNDSERLRTAKKPKLSEMKFDGKVLEERYDDLMKVLDRDSSPAILNGNALFMRDGEIQDILEHVDSKQFPKEGKDFKPNYDYRMGGHAMVMLGRKWDPNTKQCMVLIQNWWGSSSKYTQESVEEKKRLKDRISDRVWVPAATVARHASNTLQLTEY